MYLIWADDDGRECVARFPTDAEAGRCVEGLRTRGVQDLQLFDDDGNPMGSLLDFILLCSTSPLISRIIGTATYRLKKQSQHSAKSSTVQAFSHFFLSQ